MYIHDSVSRHLFFRFALAWAIVAGSAVPGDSAGLQIRVLSYNIHHAGDPQGQLDLPRIAETIKRARADLVAMQEVDQNTERSEAVDQVAVLANLTGMHHAFGANIDLQGGKYGTATLSRYPILDQRNVHLPRVNDGEQRGVLIVRVQPSADQPVLRFFNTHLDHRADDTERLQSVDVIHRLAEEDPSIPTLLAGDLNARPNSRVLERLQNHFRIAGDQELPTAPASMPTRQIDYVLFARTDNWTVKEVRVLPADGVSDHRPILAILELLP